MRWPRRRSRAMSSRRSSRIDFVVAPSGSCAGMIRVHYPRLLQDDDAWGKRADALAKKTHELFSFLVNVRGVSAVTAECRAGVAYHDSCSSLREMGVKDEPRRLLSSVNGSQAVRDQGAAGLLWVRRILLGEISRRVRAHGRRQDRRCRRHGRRDAGRRRSRMPAASVRADGAARREARGAPCGRSDGGLCVGPGHRRGQALERIAAISRKRQEPRSPIHGCRAR